MMHNKNDKIKVFYLDAINSIKIFPEAISG